MKRIIFCLMLLLSPAFCLGQETPVAKITGTLIVLIDISGSQGNVVELITSPKEALQYCQRRQFNGREVLELYWPGHPKIEFIVFTATGAQKSVARFTVPAEGDVPIPPKDDPNTLVEKINQLTAEVKVETHEEVADIFTSLASEIGAGNLRGSGAINKTTKANIAEVEGWDTWVNSLMVFLLNDLDLRSQKQWQDAFLVVAKEVVK